MQNGFVESFDGRKRDECLNEHLFAGLRQARQVIATWRDDCNHPRPHTSLDGLTPREYLNRPEKDQTRNRLNFSTRTSRGAGQADQQGRGDPARREG